MGVATPTVSNNATATQEILSAVADLHSRVTVLEITLDLVHPPKKPKGNKKKCNQRKDHVQLEGHPSLCSEDCCGPITIVTGLQSSCFIRPVVTSSRLALRIDNEEHLNALSTQNLAEDPFLPPTSCATTTTDTTPRQPPLSMPPVVSTAPEVDLCNHFSPLSELEQDTSISESPLTVTPSHRIVQEYPHQQLPNPGLHIHV